MPTALTDEQIQRALDDLTGWSLENGKLAKAFKFDSFKEAMAFMVQVGMEAEVMGHHPEWSNVYNRVNIALCTHDVGGKVSELDVKLAELIESIVGA